MVWMLRVSLIGSLVAAQTLLETQVNELKVQFSALYTEFQDAKTQLELTQRANAVRIKVFIRFHWINGIC